MERLHKLMAARGVASRRGAEALIASGVVQVNGEIVTTLGTQVDPERDRITVRGVALPRAPKQVTYLLNKPASVVASRARQGREVIVTDLVPAEPAVFPVGRLDRASEGLLLLTNDGDLALRLTHPRYAHPKTYEVRCQVQTPATEQIGSAPTIDRIVAKLTRGVKLGDGLARADSIRVLSSLPERGEYHLRIVVHEGRRHLIRRLCASVGLDVRQLRRTAIGTLSLGSLREGAFRTLRSDELANLLE